MKELKAQISEISNNAQELQNRVIQLTKEAKEKGDEETKEYDRNEIAELKEILLKKENELEALKTQRKELQQSSTFNEALSQLTFDKNQAEMLNQILVFVVVVRNNILIVT